MPRTSPESGRHPVPEGGARVSACGAYDAAPDMTVLEFASAWRSPAGPAHRARDRGRDLGLARQAGPRARLGASSRPFRRGAGRGSRPGTYTLSEAGSEALRGFYSALVRMLDGGRRLLDVAVFMSLIKEFERSGS
jgi:hypothetical protein